MTTTHRIQVGALHPNLQGCIPDWTLPKQCPLSKWDFESQIKSAEGQTPPRQYTVVMAEDYEGRKTICDAISYNTSYIENRFRDPLSQQPILRLDYFVKTDAVFHHLISSITGRENGDMKKFHFAKDFAKANEIASVSEQIPKAQKAMLANPLTTEDQFFHVAGLMLANGSGSPTYEVAKKSLLSFIANGGRPANKEVDQKQHALALAEKAFQLFKRHVTFVIGLADLFLQGRESLLGKDPLKAVPYLTQAMTLDPRDSDLPMVLGDVYQEMAMYDRAKENYRNSLKIRPDNTEAHMKLANLHLELREWRDARDEYQKIARKVQGNHIARAHLGEALFYLDEKDEAIQVLKESVKITTDYFTSNFLLGKLLFEKRDPGAKAYLETAERLNPNHTETKKLLENIRKQRDCIVM